MEMFPGLEQTVMMSDCLYPAGNLRSTHTHTHTKLLQCLGDHTHTEATHADVRG